MISRLLEWIRQRRHGANADVYEESGVHRAIEHSRQRSVAPPPSRPNTHKAPTDTPEKIEPPESDSEPLIRNRYIREDTGTHETLTILDDSIIESGEDEGFDPYNTGDFDRSRNWERRFKS